MRGSNLLAAVGAVFVLSAGAALAAEGCECCKDMASDAGMKCCDEMRPAQEPTAPAAEPSDEAPPAPAPAPAPQG